jgi:hypothetical protein
MRRHEKASPVSGKLPFLAMIAVTMTMPATRISPGTTPAMNRPPTDTEGTAMRA